MIFLDANEKCMPCVHRGLLDVTPIQSVLSLRFLKSVIPRCPAGCRLPLCAVVLLALIFGSSPVVLLSQRGAWPPPVQTGACNLT